MGGTHVHLGPIWYHSEPSDVSYSPNQFLGCDYFCCFLQQDGSNEKLAFLEVSGCSIIDGPRSIYLGINSNLQEPSFLSNFRFSHLQFLGATLSQFSPKVLHFRQIWYFWSASWQYHSLCLAKTANICIRNNSTKSILTAQKKNNIFLLWSVEQR